MAGAQGSGQGSVMQFFGRQVGRSLRRVTSGLLRGGNTPTRLRAWMVGTAVVAVLFGVLGALGISRRDASLGDAAAASQQLIAVQDIRVRLVHADALATENYLRGGIEDATKRATYVSELAAVGDALVQAGNRVLPNEATRLAEVSTALGVYSGLIEQARANNRQGYPVGQAYLKVANDKVLEMAATLRGVELSLRHQVNDNLDRADRAGVWIHALGWTLLLLVVVGGGWVAVRFRRLVNVPLALAAMLTLVLVAAAARVQGSAMNDAESAASTSLQSADLAAQGRSAAFDAHTQESLTLINRGNGAANEANWQTAAITTRRALKTLCRRGECDPSTQFEAYAKLHKTIRDLDNDGDWDGAVQSSLTMASAAFDKFAGASETVTANLSSDASRAMSTSSNGLGAMRVLVLIGGLLIAALTLAGYGQRLREYR